MRKTRDIVLNSFTAMSCVSGKVSENLFFLFLKQSCSTKIQQYIIEKLFEKIKRFFFLNFVIKNILKLQDKSCGV